MDSNIIEELQEEEAFWTPPGVLVYEMLDNDERSFLEKEFKRANKYLNYSGDKSVDMSSLRALESLRFHIKMKIPKNIVKFCLPESFKYKKEFTEDNFLLE
jgi:hypothetical protein